jgi:minimal PKS acyl carrier protein
MAEVTIGDLVAMLRECAGEEEGVDLDGDILDVTFERLGYDSLALFQTVGRFERDHGITLDDDVVTDSETPRVLLEAINSRLAEPVLT